MKNREIGEPHPIDTTDTTRKTPESEQQYADDRLVKEFVEGVALVPQSAIGSLAFTLDALLTSLPVDWKAFDASQLSPKQIAAMGKKMSALHRHSGIDVGTTATVHKFEYPEQTALVQPERFQKLWEYTVSGAINVLTACVYEVTREIRIIDAEAKIARLENFFTNPEYRDSIMQIGTIVHAIKDVLLHDTEIQQLVTQHRDTYNRRKGKKGGTDAQQRAAKIRSDILEYIYGAVKDAFSKTHPHGDRGLVSALYTAYTNYSA